MSAYGCIWTHNRYAPDIIIKYIIEIQRDLPWAFMADHVALTNFLTPAESLTTFHSEEGGEQVLMYEFHQFLHHKTKPWKGSLRKVYKAVNPRTYGRCLADNLPSKSTWSTPLYAKSTAPLNVVEYAVTATIRPPSETMLSPETLVPEWNAYTSYAISGERQLYKGTRMLTSR